jgi:hypothetical protein
MNMRRVELALLGMLIAALGAGCEKSEPARNVPAVSRPTPAPPGETVARVHWLGKRRLAAETSGTNFMDIWNLPASARLEAQTLDKLSFASWRFAHGDAAVTNVVSAITNTAATVTNAASAQLRPLLDDLVSEESYLEVCQLTNQAGELAFAIRLSDERARLWETNLAAVLESLTTIRPMTATGDRHGWLLKQSHWPNLIELARVGEWTILGAAQDHNALLGEMLARIQRDHAPAAASPTNLWVEADFDLRRVAAAMLLGWRLPADWPRIFLTVTGNGEDVLTRAKLNFAQPLPFELEAWNVPTNLIHDPIVGFTALRGASSWLSSLKIWSDLQLGAPPNQLYLWALKGAPIQTYFAAARPDAAKPLSQITSRLLNAGNSWLATNGMGSFQQSSNGVTGLVGIPFASPHLEVLTNDTVEYLYGGFLPLVASTNLLPVELYYAVTNQPNLVLYDWELTAARTDGWIFLGQTLRLMLGKPQLPRGSAGLTWLQTTGPKLGNCATALTRTGTNQLTLVRRSSMGFTAFELHLLADWLESPQFPRGLHSLSAPPDLTKPSDPPAGTGPR